MTQIIETIEVLPLEQNVLSNSHVQQKYLDNIELLHPSSLSNHKSVSSEFLRSLDKSVFEIRLEDLDKFNSVLNRNKKTTLNTKKYKFIIAKQFIRYIFKNYLEEISLHHTIIISLIQLIENIKDYKPTWSKSEEDHGIERKRVFMTKEEIIILMNFIRIHYNKRYLMYRIYLETGSRRLGVLSMILDSNKYGKIEDLLAKREIYVPKSKTGSHIYYCSEDLKDKLLVYVKKRREMNIDSNILFPSKFNDNKRFSDSVLPEQLKRIIEKINRQQGKQVVNPEITFHSFRRTLNNFRSKGPLNCPKEILELLLCQVQSDPNTVSYIDHSKGYLEYYDKYNPYKQLIRLI